MSTSSSLRQQFGAFCTNVPLGVRTLLEAPGLTTTLTAPKNGSVCVYPPLGERFSSTGSTVGGVLEKSAEAGDLCVSTSGKRAPFTISIKQGHTASMTYRVQRSCGHGWEGKADHLPVPAFNTLTPMVHPAAVCWFPWFFMPPPPKQVSFSSCAADLIAAAFVTTMLNLSSARTHAPFCSLTFLPNVILALTENPSSKCVHTLDSEATLWQSFPCVHGSHDCGTVLNEATTIMGSTSSGCCRMIQVGRCEFAAHYPSLSLHFEVFLQFWKHWALRIL